MILVEMKENIQEKMEISSKTILDNYGFSRVNHKWRHDKYEKTYETKKDNKNYGNRYEGKRYEKYEKTYEPKHDKQEKYERVYEKKHNKYQEKQYDKPHDNKFESKSLRNQLIV